MESIFRFSGGQTIDIPEDVGRACGNPLEREAVEPLVHEVRRQARHDMGSFLWIKLSDPTEAELDVLTELFDLSALQVEDCLNPRQRPKIELERHKVFIVLKELRYVEETSDVETGQVSIFAGRGYVVTIRHGHAAPGSSRQRHADLPELIEFGPISVIYAVADVIVDGYLDVSNELDNDVAGLEDSVFQGAKADNATRVYELKRENLELRRSIAPLTVIARTLIREVHPSIPAGMRPYFRDLGDHVLRAYELAELHDQLLMAMLMAVTSQQDLQQNKDMRTIAAWAAIIAVPTAIAGIYGMNFDDMPELHWAFGYPAVLGLMAVLCTSLFFVFKRSGWL